MKYIEIYIFLEHMYEENTGLLDWNTNYATMDRIHTSMAKLNISGNSSNKNRNQKACYTEYNGLQ